MTLPDADALADKQARFVLERLAEEEAFKKDVKSAIDAALATPLAELLDLGRLEATIDAAIHAEQIEGAARPVGRVIQLAVLHAARQDATKLGALVPENARKKIEQLVTKPKGVNEKLIRQLLEQEAMEETLRDVIFDALKEFNEKFNPFVADWGLPGIMKKLGPFGLGPLTKSIQNVSAEFDRRLEPEMRKFLQGFSRRAVRRMGDLVVQNSGDPKFMALRKSMVAWLYEQEVRELVGGMDDETASAWHDVGVDVAAHALAVESTKAQRKKAIEALLREHGREPLRRVLEKYGLKAAPDTDAIARAAFPAARAFFASDAARARLTALLREALEA
ncbi:MAG TPA: hypothetical protein VLM85_12560 [Polyangiaceae bacterium]|nr:hypothetical protein [Polyangiaceae bacterium]